MTSNLRLLAIATIVIGALVFGLKWAAFIVTGSVALYSDALESVVNIGAGILALVAIHVSAKPPDANHHYGHAKAEYLSAVAEGVMIVVAALLIMTEAYGALARPRALDAPLLGLAINGAATILNVIWSTILIRVGTSARSPALVGDGRHLRADVITSVGVILGLIFAQIIGWAWLDPAMAMGVALYVLWSGWSLMRVSIAGLMDAAPNAEMRQKVETVIAENGKGALQAHDLRMRETAHMTFIDFHLIVPGTMTVSESHTICDRIETALAADFSGAVISIHVEPEIKQKSGDVVDLTGFY
ncbi:cation diffusion facilitator family transporter [Oceaniglobus ichthyenteri]|uniref:cation diffusion facilitator family transporter n=1 Tax=Oceaniglobus ichthyenteri TaxID=2136177 RepID=UPI000D3CBF93|nr:cation diffusion facilitator family transporter [Oceaniglobus ichthyenteri]